ncbi:MAG: LON peptidase substrate-binding domain-containing protein, partial [Firmicutes bacterium]|nr:LON peptidase substrate-binding domain-containing protein [Bacillota bacterium]
MKKEDVALPLLITRGLILFPNNPQTIEAARGFSVMAIEESKRAFDGLILVVAQKTPDKDDPQLEDMYQIGTLCRISTFTQQKNFVRVKATPLSRVQ